jgi:capsular polysaccharide biosynthesis protein
MDDFRPRVSAFDALRSYWWLMVLLGALGAAAAFYVVKSERGPVYSAEARMSVGRVDVATQSIPGFSTASQLLADSYSRAIIANKVVQATADKTGVPVATVADHLTASPIPESGTVRVRATAHDPAQAVAVANAGADALSSYVRELNKFNPDADRLLKSYQTASRKHAIAVAKRQKLKLRTPPAKIAKADALAAQTLLEQQTAGDLYRASQAGQAAPNVLQVLAYSARAKSDKSSFEQRAAFAGAVGGLLVGLFFAMVIARVRARRQAKVAVPA